MVALSLMLMNQQYGPSRKRKWKFADLYMGPLCKALNVCVLHDGAVEKTGKWLNLCIREMTTNKKHSGQLCCEADSQRNLQSHYPGLGKQ